MATTAIDSLRGILNGFRDLNSKGIYTMNGTETDLLRQILIEVQALSIGGGIADGSVTTPKIADLNVTTPKLADSSVATAKIIDANVTPAKLSQPFVASATFALSGISVDFTGIPSWVKRITLSLGAVSTNAASNLLIQIGSGSIITAGYTSQKVTGSIGGGVTTNGFDITNLIGAANSQSGIAILTRIGSNVWICSSIMNFVNVASSGYIQSGNSSALGGPLDRIRLTAGGTDIFDSGSVNIFYE